jgi:hypothetical protein
MADSPQNPPLPWRFSPMLISGSAQTSGRNLPVPLP